MSQFSYQPVAAPQQSNGLAIGGFVCSLVGLLVTGGLLCPVGLILSLVALGRPNGKGFAVAGLILGLIGSCSLIAALIFIPALILAAIGIGVAAIVLIEPEKLELTSDMVNIAIAAKIYEEEQGVLPADLGVIDLRTSMLIDPWGNRYEYHFTDDDPGFDIVSWGKDGQSGTEDDIHLSRLDEAWEAGGNFVFDAEADDDEGRVTFSIGGKTITLHGDDEGGRVTIDTGDKVIELSGDELGGHFDVTGKDDGEDDEDHDHGEADPESHPDEDEKHDGDDGDSGG